MLSIYFLLLVPAVMSYSRPWKSITVIKRSSDCLYSSKVLSKSARNWNFLHFSSRQEAENSDDEYVWDPKLYPKLDPLEDYYQVLEIDYSANDTALKRAYYKLVIKYHPDNKSSKADKDLANRQMMVINSAYRVLKDPLLRSKYDQIRRSKKAAHADNAYSAQGYARSSTRTAGPSVNAAYATSTATSGSTSTTTQQQRQQQEEDNFISFQDFKNFLEDIYETTYPSNSEFVQSLYRRLQMDPEFRENIIRNGDFRNTYRPRASSTASQKAYGGNDPSTTRATTVGDYSSESNKNGYSTTATEVYSRGDGSLSSLKLYLQSLQRRKLRKEDLLRADKRDWGEVKDMELIRARLKAIDEVRDLGQEIEHVQDEIQELEYQIRDRRQNYNEEKEYWQHKQEVDDGRYRQYRSTHNPWNNKDNGSDYTEPQPQAQPQRSNNQPKKTGFWGDDGDYGPRWRDSQERRRRGENMSSSKAESPSPMWSEDDLFAIRDHFQNIAEEFEDFAENSKREIYKRGEHPEDL